jgi:hypothetical protein
MERYNSKVTRTFFILFVIGSHKTAHGYSDANSYLTSTAFQILISQLLWWPYRRTNFTIRICRSITFHISKQWHNCRSIRLNCFNFIAVQTNADINFNYPTYQVCEYPVFTIIKQYVRPRLLCYYLHHLKLSFHHLPLKSLYNTFVTMGPHTLFFPETLPHPHTSLLLYLLFYRPYSWPVKNYRQQRRLSFHPLH